MNANANAFKTVTFGKNTKPRPYKTTITRIQVNNNNKNNNKNTIAFSNGFNALVQDDKPSYDDDDYDVNNIIWGVGSKGLRGIKWADACGA